MKKILLIFCIIWMAMIFWFSSQSGEISSNQSNSALHYLRIIDNRFNISDNKYVDKGIRFFRDDLGLMKQYNKEYIIRKIAHFSLYFGLSSVLMLCGYVFTKSIT
ncbi:MAG TPA: VanZ family protein, partial [Peptostreptococcaceae bacterium]|nr:VanZ family protein [Peptostreptococcaceae bacterium]